MFERIKGWIRKAGEMMGLIEKVNKVTDFGMIPVSDEFYQYIITWRSLYKGFHKDIHEFHYEHMGKSCQRNLATLNMPKVVSQEMAMMIFNERCKISVSDESYNDYIQYVFKENKFYSNFQQQLEYMFAQGGMVVKPYVAHGEVKFAYATADTFLPISWDNIRITEGVFVSEFTKRGKFYTHLEWHVRDGEYYVIKNQLFESATGVDIGLEVSLALMSDTLETEVRLTNVTRPLFAYMKPNVANNIDMTLPLGVSIFANAYDTLKSLDIAFDSFQREFRLGRKRIIVPTSAIQARPDLKTGAMKTYFDTNDEVYEAMDYSMDGTGSQIQEINSTLRIQEHVDAINAQLNILSMQIGMSSGSFSFDAAGGLKTATEVVSEQSKTFKTKQSHENIIEQGITDLIDCIGVISQLYGLYNPPTEYDVTVTFDDSIAQDRTADINEQVLLISSGLQSKLDAIMKLHGLAEPEALQLLERIRKEQLGAAPEREEIMNDIRLGGVIE